MDPTEGYNATDKSRCVLKNSALKYEMAYGDDPTFLPGQCADIVLTGGKGPMVIGTFGILHPEVLKNFNLEYPCSVLEMDIECFL